MNEREKFENWLNSKYADFNTFDLGFNKSTDCYNHMPTQARWEAWQAAKADAVPEGFVLVEKSKLEHWYLDESEGMWWEHDGIDAMLCDLEIGEVVPLQHREFIIAKEATLYVAKVWDDKNQNVDCWQTFEKEEDAQKVAAYCRAKCDSLGEE